MQTSHVILQARLRAELELKQTKKELEEKAKQLDHSLSVLRATIESSADGILVTDENATLLRMNARYLQIWQIPLETEDFHDHWQLLAFCCKQMKDRQKFLNRVAEIYASMAIRYI